MKETIKICLSLLAGSVFTLVQPSNVLAQDQDPETGIEFPDSLENYVVLTRPAYDYVPDASYELIADRFSCMDTEIKIPFNGRVKAFIDYFAIRDRNYTRLMIKRMQVYFPLFEKYLAKHNMPDDLKYLAIVESGLNPRAISRAGAAGLWQFMPGTGRIYRLDRSWYVDERMDPEKATEAACIYLKQLYAMFDDWELALAAYNAGPGNVRKAIRKSGYQDSFWEVYEHLPRETRSYVPQFAAVMYVMRHAQEHNLELQEHEMLYAVQTDTVYLTDFMNLKALEEQLNLCPGEIEELNPELVRKAVPENYGKYALKVPSQVKDYLKENLVAIYDSTSTKNSNALEYFTKNEVGSTYEREKITYSVRRGDYLGRIADLHNVRVTDIRHWNRLSGNTVHVGQKLTIYVKPSEKSSINSQLAKTNTNSSKPVQVSGNKVYYVQPGDTLWEISRKHAGVSIDDIKKLNNLKTNEIKVGQKLIISR